MRSQQISRHSLLLFFGLLVTIFTAIWVNLLTQKLQTNDWVTSLAAVGWNHLWLAFSVFIIFMQILLIKHWKNEDDKQINRTLELLKDIEVDLFQSILKIAVEGIRALRADVKINARFFYVEKRENRTLLKKQPKIHIETVHMPDEYGLDYAIIEEDRLVICDAFVQRSPIYAELSGNPFELYGKRIVPKIDPLQKWVLACPVFFDEAQEKEPGGVICFYSTKIVAKTERDVLQLKQVAVSAANSLNEAVRIRRTLVSPWLESQ